MVVSRCHMIFMFGSSLHALLFFSFHIVLMFSLRLVFFLTIKPSSVNDLLSQFHHAVVWQKTHVTSRSFLNGPISLLGKTGRRDLAWSKVVTGKVTGRRDHVWSKVVNTKDEILFDKTTLEKSVLP